MCTGISYKSMESNEYFGRTQEFGTGYDYIITQFPKNYEVNGSLEQWTTIYSVLGVGVDEKENILPGIVDGINEKGLAATTQYFADEFIYSPISEIKEAGKVPVSAEQFIFYILSNCANITDVKNILEKVAIADKSLIGNSVLPQHFFFKDVSGTAIIVEPSVKLGFKVYENHSGVMTNSPNLGWHLTNLKNYSSFGAVTRPDLNLQEVTIHPFGDGSKIVDMPGDYTATSRFIRASLLLNLSNNPDDQHAINYGFHVLSTSDIVKGIANEANSDEVHYTQYTTIYDLSKRVVYIKLYDNLSIQAVSFDDTKSNSKEPVQYALTKEPTYSHLN